MAEFLVDGKPQQAVRWSLAAAYCFGRRVEWTGTYEEYLQSAAWRNYRERIIDRDGRRCRLCANPERLTVHHSSYAFLGAERDQDVITLCEPCHFDFHKWRKRPKLLATVIEEGLELVEREHPLPLGSPSNG